MTIANKFVPKGAVKFRENSADQVVFHLKDHSVELPHTLTITRTLPEPRRGHYGTQKFYFNYRKTINMGSEQEKKLAPVITKIETSVPVGAEAIELANVLSNASLLIAPSADSGDIIDALRAGLLPDAAGEISMPPGEVYFAQGT